MEREEGIKRDEGGKADTNRQGVRKTQSKEEIDTLSQLCPKPRSQVSRSYTS